MVTMKHRAGPIAPTGYRFIVLGLLLALGGWWLNPVIGAAGIGVTLFFLYFFRDPERPLPADPHLILAPADGRVVAVKRGSEVNWQGRPAQKLSIFMNLFDVHVNRAPVAGRIVAKRYQPGRFLAADRPEAALQNEQLILELKDSEGLEVTMIQIAGLLARRIVSYVQEGEQVAQGERVGLICFGSRVDLYLPPTWRLEVQLGQKVKAGSTIIGRKA